MNTKLLVATTLVFFTIFSGCEPSEEEQTANPLPTPTATPTPSPSPTPTADYLHNQPLKNWLSSSPDERRDSAMNMTKGVFKSKDPDKIAYAAKELEDCLTKLAESKESQDQIIVEMATMCAMGMGW